MKNIRNQGRAAKERGKSSTSDVLGTGTNHHRVHGKWAQQHRILTQLREEFTGQKLTGTEAGKGQLQSAGEHMADAASDSYDRDWALAMLSSAQNALYEIDEALNRIRLGTYGLCELTGKPIEAERLKAIPWARFSAAAQAQVESRGAGGRTQLGQLGSYFHGAETEAADEDAEELKQAA